VLAGLTLVGTATPLAVGHSQLVTSLPAAGDVTTSAPTEIRLVFSEPIEAAYSKLDLLDADGNPVGSGIGAPDQADPYSLVAPIPKLGDGLYTVDWRALSAADGHTTSGFFTFGVGDVTPPAADGMDTGMDPRHPGQDAGTSFLEAGSRVAGDLGLLLALGLPVLGWLVLRDPRSVGLARIAAASLGLAFVGAAGLIALGGMAIGVDPSAYIAGSRTGQLLFVRGAIALGGAALVLGLARPRAHLGYVVGALAGYAGLVLVAIGGHAAAYDSPAPSAAMIVHLVAVSVWLAGILVLAWFAITGTARGRSFSLLVPRFSALALVSVGLLALTGVYSDWIQTRALVSLDTQYGTTLAVKVALAIGAFSLGAFNYVSGGREGDRLFRPRVVVESGLAIAVLIVTGVLASGSPPAQEKPVAIAAVPTSVAAGAVPPSLELAPGRPGPTRFVVAMRGVPQHATVELQLQRLDSNGESRVDLSAHSTAGMYEASGGLLPADSRWDASIVLRTDQGAELSRTRYSFALDATGVSEGRATPALDPTTVAGVVLLVAAVLGLAFTLGGGTLPRVEPAASWIAVLVGSAAGAVLGVLVLFEGPRL